jgi:hypothetical protein
MCAAHLIEHLSKGREIVRATQRVQAREAVVVPLVLADAIEDFVAPPAQATAARPQANAERWQSPRGQRIDIWKQHDVRNASGFGGDHAAKAEHRTDDERRPAWCDGLPQVRA